MRLVRMREHERLQGRDSMEIIQHTLQQRVDNIVERPNLGIVNI